MKQTIVVLHSQPRAFALIATMLSLLVFSVTLSFALFQFSLGSIATVTTTRSGAIALALAEGCVEGVLEELREDALYDEDDFTLPTGECEVEIEEEGNDYTLRVSATEGEVTRRVIVEVNRGGVALSIISWLEE